MSAPKITKATVRVEFDDGSVKDLVFGQEVEGYIQMRAGRTHDRGPFEPPSATVHLSGHLGAALVQPRPDPTTEYIRGVGRCIVHSPQRGCEGKLEHCKVVPQPLPKATVGFVQIRPDTKERP